MDGLMNILHVIGVDPMAKWVVAAFGLRALWSIVAYKRCPLATGEAEVSPAEAEEMRQRLYAHSWRFLLVMLAGIGLAVAGLFKLATFGGNAPFSLFMLILGVYLFTTEPARRQVTDAEHRVVACSDGSADLRETSAALLRDSHLKLVGIEVGIVTLLLLGMLAVGGGMV